MVTVKLDEPRVTQSLRRGTSRGGCDFFSGLTLASSLKARVTPARAENAKLNDYNLCWLTLTLNDFKHMSPIKLRELVPVDWRQFLNAEFENRYFLQLEQFVASEYKKEEVFPAPEQIFNSLALTPCAQVRVVILGQDPYHGVGQAHGLCFSVQPGVAPPPSLKNIYRELANDLNVPMPDHGCLTSWSRRGVLLLNSVLTVRANQANSHRGHGWEYFTDAIIEKLSAGNKPLVFVLWGNQAQEKEHLIDAKRHAIIKSAHPSPLSAHRGFFGSRPFSKINKALRVFGGDPIDWSLTRVQPELDFISL